MRKEMIFLMMMLILLPVAITDQASLETTVSNLGPSVDEIDSTDEHLDSGKQIYKTGSDRTAKINTTIIDMNGINQISYVKAFITGPSTIGESPLTLVKIEDISVIKAIYAETFTLGNEDSLGTYTINITVSDGLEEDSDLLSLEYVLTQGKTITVCASGCNFTSIQAAINDSQIGDTIFVHNGSYDFSDGSGADFRDKNNIKLIGESKEGVILEGNYGGSGIIIIENNNIWIEKLTIKYGYQGIFIDDSANITIKEVIVMNSTWEGVRVNVSSDIDILNSEFSFNSDNGVFISESTGMLIDNVKCLNNYWHGFSISELNGIEIRDSEGLNARNQSGFYLYKVSNSNIENVNGRGNNEAGLALQSSTNNHFERIFLNSDKVGVNLVLSSPSNSFSDITILNAATDGIQAWSGSNFNNFTNTLVKGASRGIYIPSGENNKFVNLNATENTYGAYFFTGSGTTTFKDSSIGHNTNTGIYNEFSVSVVLNNTLVMSNPICDLYNGTCVDFTFPANITGLMAVSATSGSGNINLNFTAPGDNPNYDKASQYIIKYSESAITASNFDSATTYSQSFAIGEAGTIEEYSLSFDASHFGKTYYFAVKAIDDYGNYVISNTDDAYVIARNVSINALDCYPIKDMSQECIESVELTHYSFDTLRFNGTITNLGNIAEEITTVLTGDTSNESTDYYDVNENKLIIMNGKANAPSGTELRVDNQQYYYNARGIERIYSTQDTKVYSIGQNIYLGWVSPIDFPKSNYSTSEDIVVYIRIYNTYPSLMFHSIPTTIRINSTFSVKSFIGGKDCTPTTCYPSSQAGSPDIVWWTLDPLPTGTYNISINSGFDQRDLSPTISRIINVI